MAIFTDEELAARVDSMTPEAIKAMLIDVIGCLYATTDGVYDSERDTDEALSYIEDAVFDALPAAPPTCGHSVCSQNYIDTGDPECTDQGDGPADGDAWSGGFAENH